MVTQLRIYTINRGMMDAWLRCFNDELLGMMEGYGMRIDGAWVNEAKTQFIWLRSFEDLAQLQAIEASFYNSPEWLAARDRIASHVANAEIKLIEPCLTRTLQGAMP